MRLIDWLNINQGFVMSLLTAVYVFATVVIVIYNRKSIKEMEKGREEENRPYIFAYLHKDPRDVCFYLRVKNYGQTGGKINSIGISPTLKFTSDNKVEDFLKNVVLAPKQQLQFIITEKNAETSKKNYDVSMEYTSTYNTKKTYSENYKLITQYASKMGYTDREKSSLSKEANALNNIASYLDEIRNKL